MNPLEPSNIIYVNGKKTKISNVDHDITVLDFIRTNLKLSGTKEGCAEGDCGACSILLHDGLSSELKPINSCLVRVGQVVGKGIVTIEGIGNDIKPHPIQIAFSEENASQCGYCTPGFIVSGISLLNSNKKINDDTINDAISGNLCRCTGYSPIIKAIKVASKLSKPLKTIKFLEQNSDIQLGNVTYYNPKTLEEMLKLTIHENYNFLAGGTDLNLRRPIINEKQNIIICLDSIVDLKIQKITDDKLIVGSGVSIEDFLEIVQSKIPELVEILQRFGSPQIRTQGTIGGNISTSSPIGDLAPVLLALNSKIHLFGHDGDTSILLRDFYLGYRKNILKKDQIIRSIEIPLPSKEYKFFCWKLSKRYDQDISTISLSIYVKTKNNIIEDIHIAAGGVAEIPKYLESLCKIMIGKTIEVSVLTAINQIDKFVQPISDLRGTSNYRIESLKGLFKRLERCLKENSNTMSIMDFKDE